MTPKEKAEKLLNSFYNNAESRNKIGAFDEDLHKYNCKQCALIAVEEILDLKHIVTLRRNMHEMELEFWDEVKKQIEKL
jgi:hypothetical protein